MGRPQKSGLDYFPFDIDLFDDDKIQFISAKFGLRGEAILIRLFAKIYRNGYFIKFVDDDMIIFTRKIADGTDTEFIKEVVTECIKRDIFNSHLYSKHGILTSRGIQKRYLEIIRRTKRNFTGLLPEYDLENTHSEFTPSKPPFTTEETPVNSDKTIVNSELSAQSKVNKSKVNKSKLKEGEETPPVEVVTISHPLLNWIKENAPRVMELEKPLTEAEADKLLNSIPQQEIQNYLLAMHNYKDLKKKSVSTYLTLINWRRRDADRNNTNTNRPNKTNRPLGRGEVTADYIYEGWVRAYGKERADALVREHSGTGKTIS